MHLISDVKRMGKWQARSVSNASIREQDGFGMILQKIINVVKI